ncbi:MAG TPA: TonB-dependent receptor [Gemmatimonadaceae bacterium]|nr:TonB-dependent receptor [Gemmatimonadaceae bacterium]
MRNSFGPAALLVSALLATTPVPTIQAQSPAMASIHGRLVLTATAPSDDAARLRNRLVRLDDGARTTTTDSAGRFLFNDVAAGGHTVSLAGSGRPAIVRAVTLRAGEALELRIELAAADLETVGGAPRDGAARLAPVVVSASRALHVIGHLPAVSDNVIYSGKKTEVIVMDSLRANLAQDVERQILGRIPGAHFSETGGAGFPSNGVGFRGLDPTQSVEMNVRQNGVGIAADLFGYPETYYTPPSEALERIEVVRGASSLAFGPQFGGSVNYVVRRGHADTRPTLTTRQTAGSFGLVNSFNAIGGGTGAVTYYGFLHVRGADGWRPNSDYRQTTAYGSISVRVSDRLALGATYTRFRNRIHMAGGLSDEQFAADAAESFRSRNWLASPWNVSSARLTYAFSPRARLETTLSYLASDRHLVWRNEDGGPAAADSIDPATGTFEPREVERETFENWTSESRLRVDHQLAGRPATLATGIRAGWNRMYRFAGGPGSTGSDFDMRLYGGTWERALHFRTPSAAVFAEELVHVTDRLSVTPGVRYEYVRSTARGYTDVDSSFAPRTLRYPLFGIGAEYLTTATTALYASAAQAYRPIVYEALTPIGSITRVDPALHAARGYTADLGWRGTLLDALKLDLGAFYISYNDRIGTRTGSDAAGEFTETTNIGKSVHRGAEAYVEVDPLRLAGAPGARAALGSVDVFSSVAYVDARYVSGPFRGNRVEQAPAVVGRLGLTYARGPFASTLQASHTSRAFGDANNSAAATDDAAAGPIPAYTILDYAARVGIGAAYELSFGVNNLANVRYFTKRTGEYPGPGILPGLARNVYLGVGARF